ncbi:MAG TPA: four helix bundle protein [Candidatus Hydrogenedentes bacterium]|nr:four helix bundle protein [Candidatus Hydrogenedentota bacterium]HPG66092.1 four helix bundle protein [Candidatus Hydrogenedentota bacterium]
MKSIFFYEQLEVYQGSLRFAAWVSNVVMTLTERNALLGSKLLEASQEIPKAIALGCIRDTEVEREKSFDLAQERATECAVYLDMLISSGTRSEFDVRRAKEMLAKTFSLLTHVVPAIETLSV